MYAPETFLSLGWTGSTNAPSGLLNGLQGNSISVGVQKLFVTGTVASLELGGDKSTSKLAFDFATTTPNVEKVSYDPYIKINVVQPILKGGFPYLPGKILLNINKNAKDVGVLGNKMALQSLVYASLLKYHQFLSDLAILKINQDSLTDFQALYNKYEKQYNFGAISQNDLLRFRSQVQELELSVKRAEMRLGQDLSSIALALRTNLTLSELDVMDSFIPSAISNTFTSAYNTALSNGVDILQSRILLENTRLTYQNALDQQLPELNFSAGYSIKGNYSDSSTDGWGQALGNMKFNEYYLGLEFRMPFLTQSEKARVLEAQYKQKKAEAEQLSKEEQLFLDLQDKLRQMDFQKMALDQYNKLQSLNQKIVNEAAREYGNGELSSRDLVSANEDLRRIKTTYTLEIFKYKALALELEMKKGTLLDLYGIEVSDLMK